MLDNFLFLLRNIYLQHSLNGIGLSSKQKLELIVWEKPQMLERIRASPMMENKMKMKTAFTFLFGCLLLGSLTSAPAQQNDAPQKKFDALKVKAEQGDAPSQYSLGCCYYEGQGVAKNFQEALKWYRKAAEQNHAEAQCNLGIYYCTGEDYKEGLKWLRKASEQNVAKAQDELGNCYWLGLGVEKDSVEAFKWCYLAARQGNEDAKGRLLLINSSPRMTVEQITEANLRIGKFTKQRLDAANAHH